MHFDPVTLIVELMLPFNLEHETGVAAPAVPDNDTAARDAGIASARDDERAAVRLQALEPFVGGAVHVECEDISVLGVGRPRSEIIEHVLSYAFDTETNIVEVYINRLRQKIDQEHPVKLIQTVRGTGYRLGMPDR